MRTYLMKIKDKFINAIVSGQKIHEYRLNDNERRKIKCNDRIVLISKSNPSNYISVRVIKIETYSCWRNALERYWATDFKNIFCDLNTAIKECDKFYNSKEVEKYGIAVFSIRPTKYTLKDSRILLDTNIIIERESLISDKDNIANKVMISLKHLGDLNCNLFYSAKSIDEISKYKNKVVRDSVLAKLSSSYCRLQEINYEIDEFFKKSLSDFSSNDNSSIDNYLLFQLYNDRCDFLYTEDLGILNKAKKLYLDDRILTSDRIIAKINEASKLLKEYKSSFINLIHFKDVKSIFMVLYTIILLFIIAMIIYLVIKHRDKDKCILSIFNKGANLVFIVFTALIAMITFNFSNTFTMFHKLFFRNDYWVFDYRTDPVILALPEELFMILSVLIIGLLFIACFIIKFTYYKSNRKK